MSTVLPTVTTTWDAEITASPGTDAGRRHRRISLRTEVHLESDSNLYTGLTDNLSEGGLFVATSELLARGTVLDLEFSLPDGGPPIRITGVVRWIREDLECIEGPPGMGVQFVELDERAEARLERFVRLRDTLYYDEDPF
ncbi:MAG: TIGR02266 family protein [Pseudomonadota bacterium]